MKVVAKKQDPIVGKLVKCEHEDKPIIGLDGNIFVDYTWVTKDFDWERMDNEICLMLSTHSLDTWPMVGGSMPPKLKQHGVFEQEAIIDIGLDGLEELTPQQIRKYFYFKHKTNVPWFFIVYFTSDLEIEYTKECIEQFPFDPITRIVIYGSWAGSIVPCHRDNLLDGYVPQSININPGGYRPVYVYDSEMDQKHFVPEEYKAYSYNKLDYHGVDSLPYFSYTLRIDGILYK